MRRELRKSVAEDRTLDPGGYRVYSVNNSAVAKAFFYQENALHEYKVGNHLFERGISVPEFYGIMGPDSFLSRCWHRMIFTGFWMDGSF